MRLCSGCPSSTLARAPPAAHSTGRVMLGHHALLGAEVFIATGNYRLQHGTPVMDQFME